MTSTSDATTYATHGVFLLPDGRELTGKELGKLPKTEFDEALDQIPEDLRKRYQKARSRHIPKNEVSTKATQKASNAKRGGTAATTTSSAARANITTTAVTSAAAAEEAEEAETAAAEEAEAAAAPGPARKKRPRVPLAMFEPGYVSDAPPLNRLSGHTFPQGPPTFFGPQQQQAPLLLSAVLAQSPAGSVSSGMASVHPSPAVMDVLQAFAAAQSHGGSLFGAASRHSSRHSSPAPSLALQGALPASHGEAQHATWPAEAPHDEAHHGTSPGGADGGADGIFGAPLAMFLGSYAATKELGDSLRSEMQSLVGSVRSAASDGGRSGAEVGTQAALADSGVGEAMGAHTAQLNAIGAQLGTQGAQITAIGGQLDAQGSQLNAIGGQISTLQTTTENGFITMTSSLDAAVNVLGSMAAQDEAAAAHQANTTTALQLLTQKMAEAQQAQQAQQAAPSPQAMFATLGSAFTSIAGALPASVQAAAQSALPSIPEVPQAPPSPALRALSPNVPRSAQNAAQKQRGAP